MQTNDIAWKDDLLNRKSEGEYLSNYLIKRYENNKKSSFVLNINSEWGFGKTYFLSNLSKKLKAEEYPVIYFDAWKNDYTNQPLLAFISELNTSLTPYFNGTTKAKSLLADTMNISKRILLPILSKKLTGLAIEEIEDLLDTNINSEIKEGISSVVSKVAEMALTEHKNTQQSIELFKDKMLKLLKHIDKSMPSKNLPMFIFIDELDRCRPNYAIELLENIKHIFDIPGIIFVVATDSKQLAHSINAVYGDNFSSERYLKRFFNQEYSLITPNNYAYANYLFESYNLADNKRLFSPLDEQQNPNKNINIEIFSLYASFFKLSLRDQEQIVIVLSAIELTWQGNKSIHLGYLLFLIILKQKSNILFHKFNEISIDIRSTFLNDEAEKIGVDRSIEVSTYKLNRDETSREKKYSISILIEAYLSLLNKNYDNISSGHASTEIERKIISKIIHEFPTQYYVKDAPLKHNLIEYSEFVLRAGQFS